MYYVFGVPYFISVCFLFFSFLKKISIFLLFRDLNEIPIYVLLRGNTDLMSACYPQGSFYPLSDDPSTRNRRITKPVFRPCSTCLSRSQAPLCLCTRCMISNHAEGTLGRLRYFLGGDRPSQTTRLTLSFPPVREKLE